MILTVLAIAAPEDDPVDALIRHAQRSGSTAVYVEQDGAVLVDWARGRDRPADTMSMTKSFVSLLIGKLQEEGGIVSVDEPLSTWFPEAAGTSLGAAPLSAVLRMQTGIEPCEIRPRCENSADAVGFALRSARVSPVGVWTYNNNSVNLLTGLISRVTGESAATYADRVLFAPLGITDAEWSEDAKGVNFASDGLRLSFEDLIALGRMLLAEGEWAGTRVLEADTISELTRPLPDHPWAAQLWWPVYAGRLTVSDPLLDYALASGARAEDVTRLRPLVGTTWPSAQALRSAMIEALGGGPVGADRFQSLAFHSWWYEGAPEVVGYAAEGYLGQYLVVLPRYGVVAIRQRRVGLVYTEREQDPRDLPGWPQQVAAAFASRHPDR